MSVKGSADSYVRDAAQASMNSAVDEAMFAGLKGDDLLRARAQFALQKQQELVSFLSKVMKNDSEMQQINALR